MNCTRYSYNSTRCALSFRKKYITRVFIIVLGEAGMEHVSVDEKAASGECVVFRHLTVMSSFFGFLDDVWVCVKKGRCTNTTSGWEILAQGQLRMGKGDIGQNFRHIEELQDGVNVAAQSGRVRPMDC